MPIKYHIADGSGTNKRVHVVERENENALVVANTPLNTYSFDMRYFINSTYGIDMNFDASPGGVPEYVHNGTDDVYWTASAITGTGWEFSNTDYAHDGTQSIYFDGKVGDVAQFTEGGSFSLAGDSSITLWIYLTTAWQSGDSFEIYGWNTSTNTIVGNAVGLEDYFNENTTNVWQKLTIPLEDMNLEDNSIHALRITYASKTGADKTFYMDEIEIETSDNEPITYEIRPNIGENLYVDNFSVIMADAYSGTLADTTMPKIPYDSFINVPSLDNGFVFRYYKDGEVVFSDSYHQTSDILLFPHSKIEDYGTDGTNSWFKIFIELNSPIILHELHDDYLSITLSDDFSGLLLFRVSAGCRVKD